MNKFPKSILVLILTTILSACSIFMIGPQLLVIVPVAWIAGVIFAICRSFLSLVFFGYPFTYGFFVAYTGYAEGFYVKHTELVIPILVELLGYGLIAFGLWKRLPASRS